MFGYNSRESHSHASFQAENMSESKSVENSSCPLGRGDGLAPQPERIVGRNIPTRTSPSRTISRARCQGRAPVRLALDSYPMDTRPRGRGRGRGRGRSRGGQVRPGHTYAAHIAPLPGIGRGQVLERCMEELNLRRDRQYFAATIANVHQSRVGLRTGPVWPLSIGIETLFVTITKGVPGHIVRLSRP